MSARLANLEANLALFDALPEAARAELKVDLLAIANQALALQQAAAPVRTGALKAALTISEEIDRLRVRVGFPTFKGSRHDLFYAIIQEYGRKAGAKLATVRGATRLVKWGATIGRLFVHQESRIDQLVDALTARFWDNALGRAGAAT